MHDSVYQASAANTHPQETSLSFKTDRSDWSQEKGNMREQQFNLAAREKLLDTSQMDLSRSPDQELAAGVNTAADRVHSSLLDNINTGAALDALLDLVAATNKYMKQREEAGASTSEGRDPEAALRRALIAQSSLHWT